MINFENTTLKTPNGEFYVNSNGTGTIGTDDTGREFNLGIGGYGSFYIHDGLDVGVEVFYDNTSSEIENVEFSAINIVSYVDVHPFDFELYGMIGIGAGLILNEPELVYGDFKNIDFLAKIGLAYEFNAIGRLEIGGYPSITDVIDERLSRSKYYLGIKIPLNTFF